MQTLFKYLIWLTVSLTCLLLATITISEFLVESAVDAPYDEKIADYAGMLANEVEPQGAGLRIRPRAVQLLRSDRKDHIWYSLRDDEGRLLAGDSRIAHVVEAPRSRGAAVQNGQVDDEPVRVAALQVPDPRDADRVLTIQVAETLHRRESLTEALRAQAVALPELLVLVTGILLIVYGYTFIWRPMQRLRALIDNRGFNDLSPLDPEAAPQDLRPLILSINGLMERLAVSSAAQRRFIADAAHQLRTPLAGIRSQAERALTERNPGAVRVALQRVAHGTQHATELANRLLTLARAGTPLTAPPADVDLLGVVRDTIAEHLPHALSHRHDLGFDGVAVGSRCIVRGDALLLRELLSNLIDNALRYSPDGGAITVAIRRDDETGAYALAVCDTGPGIAPEERERVFEPFYRGADVVAPGTGLGLAIVRTIAVAHGATVSLAGSDSGGLRVTVQFPPDVFLAA